MCSTATESPKLSTGNALLDRMFKRPFCSLHSTVEGCVQLPFPQHTPQLDSRSQPPPGAPAGRSRGGLTAFQPQLGHSKELTSPVPHLAFHQHLPSSSPGVHRAPPTPSLHQPTVLSNCSVTTLLTPPLQPPDQNQTPLPSPAAALPLLWSSPPTAASSVFYKPRSFSWSLGIGCSLQVSTRSLPLALPVSAQMTSGLLGDFFTSPLKDVLLPA